MNQRLRILRVWWLLMCIGLLVACAPAAEPEAAQLPLPITAIPAVTLSFGALETERAAYQPLIDRFNAQNPTIRVAFVALDSVLARSRDQGQSARAQAIAEAADTSTVLPLAPELQQQYLQNLVPLVDADATFNQADFYPSALVKQANGELYYLPQQVGVPVLAYNKDLWQQVIGPLPTPNWTWGDMLLAAYKLTQKSRTSISRYGMVDDSSGRLPLGGLIAQRDPTLRTKPLGDLKLNTPVMIDVYNNFRSLQASGIFYTTSAGSGSASLRDPITRSRIGMWPAGVLRPQDQVAFSVGYTVFPDIPLSFESVVQGVAISRSSQHPEAAWRWLAFLSQQGPIAPIQEEPLLYIPARRSVAEQSGYWRQWNDEDAARIQQIAERTPAPQTALSVAPTWLWRIAQTDEFGIGATTDIFDRAQQAFAASLINQATRIPAQPAARPVASPVTVPAGTPLLTFAVNGGRVGLFAQVAEAFMRRHPELHVRVVEQSNGSGDTSLSKLATTSDCFVTPELPTPETAPQLLDLSPLINADASFDRADIPAGLQSPFTLQGRTLALPYRFWPQVLAYNEVLFDKQALPHPSADWSATTLVVTAKELTHQRDGTVQYGFAFQRGGSSIGQVLDWFGAALTKDNGGNRVPQFTNPQTVAALQAYIALRQSSPEPAFTSYRADDRSVSYTIQYILDGNVGMWLDRGLSVRKSAAANQTKLQVRLAPLPQFAGTTAALAQPTGFYIAVNSPHADACWTWFKYISQDIAAIDDGFPARQSVATSTAFVNQAPVGFADVYAAYAPALQKTNDLSSNTAVLLSDDPPFDPYWLEDALSQAIEGTNLEDALQQAQQRTEAFITCRQNSGTGPDCATQVDPTYQGWRNARQ